MNEKQISRTFLEVIPWAMGVVRTEMRSVASADLSVIQFRVLANLSGRARSNRELAEAIGVSVAAMSRLVDGLVKKRLVERRVFAEDRRQVDLTLSAAGRRKLERLREAAAVRISRRLAALDPELKRELARGLGAIGRALKESSP